MNQFDSNLSLLAPVVFELISLKFGMQNFLFYFTGYYLKSIKLGGIVPCNVFSGVLQESGGFPVGAIIAICVTATLVLCLVFLLVWLVIKKNARKSVGELMSQLIQLLIGTLVYNPNVSLSTVLPTTN